GFGASRAAVNYLCQSLADEYSRFPNFRANVLIPGCVDTPQRRKTHPGESPTERTPINEIVPKIVWYLSDNSIGKTGEIVYLQEDE
ncbi:MAG: NAD(P)-dependent oxidoreductase, partial [Neisseriaceae bacterium]|nr:NAD(P)-dependent oxidoreductase [Neisseriaceae bacterium]